jgi:hypothetical protein
MPETQQPMSYTKARAAADYAALRAEGIAAYRAGKGGDDCPHPYGTAKSDFWWGGFFDAWDGRV